MSRANWLQPGFNTWAFQHTGSVLPTANVVVVRQSSQPSAVTEFADSNDFVLFHALAEYLMKF